MGLMAEAPPLGTTYHASWNDSKCPHEPWSWIAEVAVTACGCVWDPEGHPIDPSILGGSRFNNEEGRGTYHDRDYLLTGSCLALPTLSHQDILLRLQRENQKHGWDHTTKLSLSCSDSLTPRGRVLLWNALYAGSHVVLTEPETPTSFSVFFSKNKPISSSLGALSDFWIS